MATLWYSNDSTSADHAWSSSSIHRDADLGNRIGEGLHFVPFGAGTDGAVALLIPGGSPAVWINGQKPVAGLRALDHRDEIIVGGRRVYYSAESRPEIKVYRAGDSQRRPRCVICRNAIEAGQPSVVCPRCGRLYHQIASADSARAKECWTYHGQCLCGHPTALNEGTGWRPESEACCE